MPSKKKKTLATIVRKNNANKPEKVFKVIPRSNTVVVRKKTKPKKKHSKKYALNYNKNLSKKTIVISIFCAIFIALIVLSISGKQVLDSIDAANRASTQGEYTKDTLDWIRLVGNESQYPDEIINYQSAPIELQEFVLKDYKDLKIHCIVNGKFVGSVRYEIVNVVYDSFARISKECNGADTVIVAKISGVWTVVLAGNDLPKCSDINAFDIPRGVAPQCRTGYVTYANPNP